VLYPVLVKGGLESENFKIRISYYRIIVPRWWRPPPPVARKLATQGHSRGVPDSSTIISCSTIIFFLKDNLMLHNELL